MGTERKNQSQMRKPNLKPKVHTMENLKKDSEKVKVSR